MGMEMDGMLFTKLLGVAKLREGKPCAVGWSNRVQPMIGGAGGISKTVLTATATPGIASRTLAAKLKLIVVAKDNPFQKSIHRACKSPGSDSGEAHLLEVSELKLPQDRI